VINQRPDKLKLFQHEGEERIEKQKTKESANLHHDKSLHFIQPKEISIRSRPEEFQTGNNDDVYIF
jgi:hypothetical protein